MSHRLRSLATAPLALACALTFTFTAAAARAETSPAAPQDDHAAMAARHHEMMARVAALDARIDELVAAMNAAPRGPAKVDAVAAAVTELAAQRKELRDMLIAGMHAAMESHGGGHAHAAKGHACMEHHGKAAGASCCAAGAACCGEGAACCASHAKAAGASCCAEGAACCSEGAACCAHQAAKGKAADDGTCHAQDAATAAEKCAEGGLFGGPSRQ